jgi:hypothetical protein
MKKLIKEYLKNELFLARPKNTNVIIIDDLVLKLAKEVFSISDEYIDLLIEEIKQDIEYEVYVLSRKTISSQWFEIKEKPDNHYILLDLLCCVIQMKIRSFTNVVWYDYLRYLEGVITDEIIGKNKKPSE